MDEFKPEDELKPDPSDRRTGRSRQSSERDNEPQINFDDVDLMQTIVALRVAATRAMSVKTRSLNPKKS